MRRSLIWSRRSGKFQRTSAFTWSLVGCEKLYASSDAPPNCRSNGARSSRSHVSRSPISARKWERAPSAFQKASNGGATSQPIGGSTAGEFTTLINPDNWVRASRGTACLARNFLTSYATHIYISQSQIQDLPFDAGRQFFFLFFYNLDSDSLDEFRPSKLMIYDWN